MAIRLVVGVPGGGKSYYIVDHLTKNYLRWNEEKDWWDEREDVVLLTNIDGLKVGKSLDEAIAKAGGLAKFFDYAAFESWLKGRRCVIIIDEAQIWFGRDFSEKSAFTFFQKHRHLGLDIYLITQDVDSLVRELRAVAEYRVECTPRLLSLFGEFRYRFYAGTGRTHYKSKSLRPRQEVFALYKSMSREEVEKIGSAPRRYAVMIGACVLLLVCTVGYFRSWFVRHTARGNTAAAAIAPRASDVRVAGPGGALPVQNVTPALQRGGPGGLDGKPVAGGSVAGVGGSGGAEAIRGAEGVSAVPGAAGAAVVAAGDVRVSPPGGGAAVLGVRAREAGWRRDGVRRIAGVNGEGESLLVTVEDEDGSFRTMSGDRFTRGARRAADPELIGEWVAWWFWGEAGQDEAPRYEARSLASRPRQGARTPVDQQAGRIRPAVMSGQVERIGQANGAVVPEASGGILATSPAVGQAGGS